MEFTLLSCPEELTACDIAVCLFIPLNGMMSACDNYDATLFLKDSFFFLTYWICDIFEVM